MLKNSSKKSWMGAILLFQLLPEDIIASPRSKAPRDLYYRRAKQEGFRARSAFKLMEIDDEFRIFHQNVSKVLDLCAAPGSWSQVIKQKLLQNTECQDNNGKIVAVDLQRMRPIPGVMQVRADITRAETQRLLNEMLEGKCDLVVCDGAPDLTGLHELDAHLAHTLVIAALRISASLLKVGGNFVAKVFIADPDQPFVGTILHTQLRALFDSVTLFKPSSSRSTSHEHFVVCRSFSSALARFLPDAMGRGDAAEDCACVLAHPDEAIVPLISYEALLQANHQLPNLPVMP